MYFRVLWSLKLALSAAFSGIQRSRRAERITQKIAQNATGKSGEAKLLLIQMLRPLAEPYLESKGLEWEDVVPALEAIDSNDELQDAIDDPEGFFANLADSVTESARAHNYYLKKEVQEHG